VAEASRAFQSDERKAVGPADLSKRGRLEVGAAVAECRVDRGDTK
jgi:hypothetical protein